MIKILHVISDKNIGGAGKLLLNLLIEGDREKFDFFVILPCNSLLKPKINKLNIHVIESDFSLSSLIKIIKSIKPQIVHTHAAATARIAAKLCGVPVKINTRHCANDGAPSPGLYKILTNKLFDCFFTDMTIATAHYVKKVLISEGIPQKKIAVIINGSHPLSLLSAEKRFDIRRKLGYSKSDFLVGIIARLEHGKGHEDFIKAAKICQKSYPDIKFIIVGDGALSNQLKSQAKELTNLTFTGFIDNVIEIMNIIDANVNCSFVSETSSLSLSEGMSVGAVPVVSNCGGNPFMAKNCGLVFKKRNPESLAKALITLSKAPKLKEELSRKATDSFFANFTAKQMTQKNEKIYLALLKNR